ncbi:uncharacterized protein LOC143032215 isoform X2 [Oratosquilla oratoria]|uniref:uncharacterized protein LOC143032215 isoform X2 n=1 Tax=Oratosquilla oratoria TaxID=337810 RepID=UPI003F777100
MSSFVEYEPTTHPYGSIIFGISFLSNVIAFSTPYWLKNDGEGDPESQHFVRIGLWEVCFTTYNDFKYLFDRIYDGCYWTLDEEMHVISDQMHRPFFVTVQVFFTFCFTLALISCILVGILVLCPGEDIERQNLKILSIILFISFGFGFIAVLVFGCLGDSRDWMPHWHHNHLSWSFGLAVVGVVAEFVAAVLFWVEYRIQTRKESYRQGHGVFTLESKT